jgi:hypothetical protein
MEFRWVALIALWTCIAGPIFGGASGSASRHNSPKAAVKHSAEEPPQGVDASR